MVRATVHDPQAEGRRARERFSTAYMSDTKWRKFISAVAKAQPSIKQMIVKFIDVDEPKKMRFPPDLRCPRAYMDTIEFGPTELRSIEWLQVIGDLSETVAPIGLFSLVVLPDGTRVAGYADPIPTNVR